MPYHQSSNPHPIEHIRDGDGESERIGVVESEWLEDAEAIAAEREDIGNLAAKAVPDL